MPRLGRSLPDVWTGTRHRGVQLHDLRAAVTVWAARYGQRAWFRQLDPVATGAMDDAALRAIARLDGTPFPSTAQLAARWLAGRAPVRGQQDGGADLETAYCAQLLAVTYQAMGLLPGSRHQAGMTRAASGAGTTWACPPVPARWRDRRAPPRRRRAACRTRPLRPADRRGCVMKRATSRRGSAGHARRQTVDDVRLYFVPVMPWGDPSRLQPGPSGQRRPAAPRTFHVRRDRVVRRRPALRGRVLGAGRAVLAQACVHHRRATRAGHRAPGTRRASGVVRGPADQAA